MDPPIIPHERLETFIRDVFNNIDELYVHHKRLLHSFFEIQRAEHPIIRSVAAPMNDTSLGFRDVYMDYLTNYPVAVYRVEEEMAKNPLFKDFVKVSPPCLAFSNFWLYQLRSVAHRIGFRTNWM